MKLKPSEREKVRYVVYEIVSRAKTPAMDAYASVRKSLLRLTGELGLSRSGMQPMAGLWNSQGQRGMLRIQRSHVDKCRAAICLVSTIRGRKAVMRSITTSGMISKAREHL